MRPLSAMPYVYLDARYEKVREDGVIQSQAVLIAIGLATVEDRRILVGALTAVIRRTLEAPQATRLTSPGPCHPAWAGSPVWIHSDLLRPNVLVRDGRVEQLGGTMAVTSRPGAGTEVELRVPTAGGQGPATREDERGS